MISIFSHSLFLDLRQWPEKSYDIGSVVPSVLEVFLKLVHKFFLEHCKVLWAHMMISVTEPDFFEKMLLPRKYGFLNLLKTLVINFSWIWSIMIVHIVCYSFAQIPYIRNDRFLRYQSKYSWPIRLQDFEYKYISRTKWWNDLIFFTNSWKLKVEPKILR